jgi:hypothetical protein
MTVTSKVMPGSGAPTPQANAAAARGRLAPELGDNIVAKPLGELAADSYRLKDHNFELRLVNYSVGEKESKLRFHEMRAKGYVIVKPEELEAGSAYYETMDGAIRVGDCILMKIPKAMIQGAKKFNWEKAMRRRGAGGLRDAQDVAKNDLASIGAPRSQINKVQTFVPGQAQIDALTGTDSDKK